MLLVGLTLTALWYPSAPVESWSAVHGFQVDAEECRALRQERDTTVFRIPSSDDPDGVEGLVTFAEVARRYNLELALVCQVNGLPDGCGAEPAAAAQEIVLPLSREREDPPSEGGG